MEPVILLLAGVAVVVAGVLVLRSFGAAYRVGRLLATTPLVTVGEANALARGDDAPYVRVEGRVDSDAPFLDDAGRPLVLRRARLQVRRQGRWSTLDERRDAVTFKVRQGLDEIGVASAELDAGLVVVPRESTGTAAEIPDRVPPGTPADARLRYRLDLVSAVDHATVLGVPRLGPAGGAILGAGAGRPLILATLEPEEAMRILTGGGRGRSIAAASLLVTGLALVAISGIWALAQGLP